MMNEFTEEEKTKIQNVVAFVENNSEEINRLNHRLFELRSEFSHAFNANEIQDIFTSYDEENDYTGYDTDEFNDISVAAEKLGLGFSYEDYYLWQPSTASC